MPYCPNCELSEFWAGSICILNKGLFAEISEYEKLVLNWRSHFPGTVSQFSFFAGVVGLLYYFCKIFRTDPGYIKTTEEERKKVFWFNKNCCMFSLSFLLESKKANSGQTANSEDSSDNFILIINNIIEYMFVTKT